jgi:hypothetical protein
MANLDNLGTHADGVLIAQSQSQKEVTSNALDNLLSNATQSALNVAITDGAGSPTLAERSLSDDEFFGNFLFILTGTPSLAFDVVLPALGGHCFAVVNQTGQTATLRVGAGASVVIATATARLLHSDGTDVIALAPAS